MTTASTSPAETVSATEAPTIAPTPAGRQVSFDISLNDNFFEPSAITARAGDVITFNITNRTSGEHGGPTLHGMHIAGADNVFQDLGSGEDDAGVVIVSPSETTSFNWTVPTIPGTYSFRCPFHSDMLGTITVN